jgi:aminopeptidase
MQDPRLDRLAGLFLSHSLRIERGQGFHITADTRSLPLVKAILREARRTGTFAQVEFIDQEISRLLYDLYDPDDGGASAAFLSDKTEAGLRRFQNLVGDILIFASSNDQELNKVPLPVRQFTARFDKKLLDYVVGQKRWVIFEYPTPGQAQRAGLSYDDYRDYVLDAACLDYATMQKNVRPLVRLMQSTDRVQILGAGTDLSFSIKGMRAIPCCGESNIPDGECFTAPVRGSVQGVVSFNAPSLFWGHLFSQVRLTFQDGRIVKATASQSDDFFSQILDSDEGARYLGEFALGFNPIIRDPFANVLFDEKISGSFHVAVGASYGEAANGNDSAIHWDLVQIQRPEYGGGEIWFDGRLIRKDGRFTLPELAALNN